MSAERVFSLSELKPVAGSANKSTIWNWVKRGLFPEPRRLGNGKVVWFESDLERWQQERKAAPYVKRVGAGGRPKGTTKQAIAERRGEASPPVRRRT